MSFMKYRVHEVAKDFGVTSKVITEILTKYATTPKNHMQVLDDKELSIIFEYMTQHNQMSSIAEIFEDADAKEPEKPKQKTVQAKQQPAPKQEEKAAEAPAHASQKQESAPQDAPKQAGAPQKQGGPAAGTQKPAGNAASNAPKQGGSPSANPQKKENTGGASGQKQGNAGQSNSQRQGGDQSGGQRQGSAPQRQNQGQGKGQNQNQNQGQGQGRGQNQPNQGQGKQQKQEKNRTPKQVPQKKVVDTRGSVATNLSKYDERYDRMAGDKADKMKRGKEKIGGRKRNNSAASSAKRRQEEKEKMQRLQLEIAKKAPTRVQIPDEISVQELAVRMKKTGPEVVRKLVGMGVMAALPDTIDYETAALVAMEFNCRVEREVIVTVEERLIDDHVDTEEELKPRAPVVVVMGHVDHGKTSLLDYIRDTRVAEGEAGGITQAIGAYVVDINGSPVTFLDTPGHEAFTSMRARGAMVTDVAILVVAATEGIKPQTIESINHAKAANIPIVVAINKMDMPGANPERVKQQLTEYDLVPDDWGGDTIVCQISAKTGQGVDELLEMLALQTEMLGLRANPDRAASGAVIEARLDKGRGPIMTVLVQNGTLKQGDIIIAGTAVGRVRAMMNDKGQRVATAGPSVPVEISGMSEVPNAGDVFNAVADERMARELVAERKEKAKAASALPKKVSLDDLFARIQEGEMKDFNIIVKADVKGSAEAVKASLEKLTNEEVRVKVIHCGVGAINESDVMLADTSNAVIVGFNVRPDNAARDSAARANVDIRLYRVIYDCINEIETAMKGMLAPKYQEKVVGHAEVRKTYKVSKVGMVCGCYVLDGKILRNSQVRVLRDNIVVFEGNLASLRRFKDDVREVASGYECGMQVEKFNDIKELDVIECFIMEQINA